MFNTVKVLVGLMAAFVILVPSCRMAPMPASETPPNTERWKSFCQVSNNVEGRDLLQCALYKGQMVDYREIRNWTANETGKKYEVVFVCADGTVYLPWPFKANNVVSLEVKGCKIEGFLSEMTKTPTIQDQLKSLVISDVSVEVNLSDLFETFKNIHKITKAADCGQLTIEKLVFNNIHYNIKVSPEERHKHYGGLPTVNRSGDSPHTQADDHFCKYSNLKYLDESGSRQTGRYHWKLLTENSIFPKLEIYRLANNSLAHVPQELIDLDSKKFPKLAELDLSNNSLEEFEFNLPNKTPSSGIQKLVDLRNNNIRSISVAHARQLKNTKNIVVDLRDNPLLCDCRLKLFRQYLKEQYKKTSLRQMVTEITCKAAMKDVPDKIVEFSLLDPSFEQNCVK